MSSACTKFCRGLTHKIFVVARSCNMPEIYFEWSQGLRHIKHGLAMGTRQKKKDMSWLCRGCVASQSCDSRGTIVSCRALSGRLFFTQDCRTTVVGRSRVRLPTIRGPVCCLPFALEIFQWKHRSSARIFDICHFFLFNFLQI